MIDSWKIQEAKSLLEQHVFTDSFTDQQLDIKLIMKSLLGILYKSDPKTFSQGLALLDEAQELSDEIQMVYERLRWLKIMDL